MHKATHPDERLQNLLERGEADGCLQLSDVESLIEAVGLDEDASAALLDEIASREIVIRDDCGRDLPEPTYVNDDIAETTTDALQLFHEPDERPAVDGWRAHGLCATLLPASEVEEVAREADVVLSRLDVLPTLDGVERGLLALLRIERRGIVVLNRAQSLVAVHDKLQTATALARAGLPHPTNAACRGRPCVLETA